MRIIPLLVVAVAACATTSTQTTTWSTNAPLRYGRVEMIREVVQHTEGNPAGGAVAGGVIGALLFSRTPVVGAIAGAGVGAAASQASSTSVTYHVLVRYDDGAREEFVFSGYEPFRPGDLVELTARGLEPYRGATLPPAHRLE